MATHVLSMSQRLLTVLYLLQGLLRQRETELEERGRLLLKSKVPFCLEMSY